ncbi:MAG: ABC transporter substrate-binding protein [Rhodoferax sp.]|uniref:ABC transporter substrate-binding protein n=1 Tax=Rhodoferax sp. TaxID=50421 RepID=UPI002ACD2D98|nr:ABC transporter substrate-binding protein [Rhodoferax sp.]MDZ7893076.1 ABC transporter substrate-binding protein [Rhodoferax sp.]
MTLAPPPSALRRALLLSAAVSVSTAIAQTGPSADTRVLKVVAPWEIGSLDPSKTGYVFTRLEITETLVDVDTNGQLAPGLAARWTVSADQKTWRFALRPGALFHDRSPVTPEAVVRSLERALAQPGVLKNTPIQRIAAVNGEVQIELKQAFTAMPAFLAHNSTQILAPASFAADGSVQAVVGSGPYQVVRVNAPQKLETAAFEGWTGKRPAVQRVGYLASGRGETRGMLAESGQADLVFTHDAVAIERLKRNPRLQFHTLPIPRTLYLKVNAAHPLLKDIKVRQAISLAIDRPGIAQAILREPKAAATQLFSPGMSEWHVPGLQPLVRDTGRARQLLQEAGWVTGADGLLRKDGRPFKLTLRTFSDRPEQPPMATAIQAQLREVGMDVAVAIMNASDIPAGHQDGSLELALVARNYALVPDPIGSLLQDFGPKGGDWGAMGWQSAQVTSALESLSTTNDPARRSRLRGALSTVLQAELPVIPVAWYQHTATHHKRIGQVSVDPLERSYRISQFTWTK